MIGNCGYGRATSSSDAARCRCCHSGAREFGSRRGSSRARAAHSRKRAANRAEEPTSRRTSSSISSGLNTNRSAPRSEEHTSELQSRGHLVCRLLLEKKKNRKGTSKVHSRTQQQTRRVDSS